MSDRASLIAITSALVAACGGASSPALTIDGVASPNGSTTAAATVKAPPIDYAIASCPLRYEASYLLEPEAKNAVRSMHSEIDVAFESRPVGGRVELTGTVASQIAGGKYRSAAIEIQNGYAPVHLETDGGRWIERDGPTDLYDGLAPVGGLVWFFPDLPRSGAPGAIADWTLIHPDWRSIIEVEAARGSRAGMKERRDQASAEGTTRAASKPIHLEIRLERWSEAAGEKIAELSVSGTADIDEAIDDPSKSRVVGTAKYRGTYAVTAKGRVLRAMLERDIAFRVTSSIQPTPTHLAERITQRMNLVAACDGPTEASLARPLGREERAIRAWRDGWAAWANGDRDHALAAFDPALRKKISDARLWDALSSYRTLRGDRALAGSSLVADADVTVEGDAVRITSRGLVEDPTSHAMTPIEVVVAVREIAGAWAIVSVRADLVLEKHENLLDVGADHAIVRKGWPPR